MTWGVKTGALKNHHGGREGDEEDEEDEEDEVGELTKKNS